MNETLPPALLKSLQDVAGFEEEPFKKVHQEGNSITSIRLNPLKKGNDELIFPVQEKISWSSHGFYLPERPSFTLDPLFHAGAYYVQEASSMFLEQAITQSLDLSEPLRVLDLCAAPGGKSTLIQSLLSPESFLISNEVIKTRIATLSENLLKWGGENVVVTQNDARDFQRLPGFFDLIVVDAPCSGSGLFRKDPKAIEEWSEQNVVLCSQRQQRILADVIPALKENGILIYATCSYSYEEDETIVDWLLEDFEFESLRLQIEDSWNIIETETSSKGFGYRFYPDKLKGEGFFIAALRKKTGDKPSYANPELKSSSLPPVSKAELSAIQTIVKDDANLEFMKWKDEAIALPQGLASVFSLLQKNLYIRQAGINLGQVIRHELIPSHDLALSLLLNNSVTRIDCDNETALDYLRKKDISLPVNHKGWALLTYKNSAIGWVKILHNRINNYYPKSMRILNK